MLRFGDAPSTRTCTTSLGTWRLAPNPDNVTTLDRSKLADVRAPLFCQRQVQPNKLLLDILSCGRELVSLFDRMLLVAVALTPLER